jgi:hypothetical protein
MLLCFCKDLTEKGLASLSEGNITIQVIQLTQMQHMSS